MMCIMSFFFFQAEDGIRDLTVTGVQTCALPIWYWFVGSQPKAAFKIETGPSAPFLHSGWIGDDRFFAVTPLRVAMFSASDGSQLWAVDLPKDEIKGSKFKGDARGADDEWFFDFEPTVKLV